MQSEIDDEHLVLKGCLGDGLGRGFDVQRFAGEPQMLFDRGLRQAHDRRNVLHRLAISDPFQRFALTFGQGLVGWNVGQGEDLEILQYTWLERLVRRARGGGSIRYD